MAKPDSKYSAGARLERAAFVRHLRSRMKHINLGDANEIMKALAWVDQRRLRYDRKPGGLGR